MTDLVKQSRCIFIRQMIAAPVGAKIPVRLRKGGGQTHTWSVEQWIAEFIRTPVNSHHVSDKLAPESVFGLAVHELPLYCADLIKKAGTQTVEYFRRGKVHIRKQKSTQPVLMCVVTSWPEPDMLDTDERKAWLALTTTTMQTWYGGNLKAGIAHSDEAFFHVHWLVDLEGLPVRRLHAGHAMADAEPVKRHKGEAYRTGTKKLVSDFWAAVGIPLNLQRMSPTPRPRLSRSQAQRNRQYQLEIEAIELRKRNAELEQTAEQLAKASALHHENVAHFDADFERGQEFLDQQMAAIELEAQALERDRFVLRAMRVEYEEKKLRIEAEAAALWKVIGDAVEKTKAWQLEVRDQLTLESRVAKVKSKFRPQGWYAGMGGLDADGDLSDVPL